MPIFMCLVVYVGIYAYIEFIDNILGYLISFSLNILEHLISFYLYIKTI